MSFAKAITVMLFLSSSTAASADQTLPDEGVGGARGMRNGAVGDGEGQKTNLTPRGALADWRLGGEGRQDVSPQVDEKPGPALDKSVYAVGERGVGHSDDAQEALDEAPGDPASSWIF